MKKCTKCKYTKLLSEFGKKTKDRLHSQCKVCISEYHKEYQRKNKDKELARRRERYKTHKEEELANKRKYYQVNKEHIATKKKLNYLDSKDKILQDNRDWYNENKPQRLEQVKKYNETPQGFYSKIKASAKKRNISFEITKEDFIFAYNDWVEKYNTCHYCNIPYDLMIKDDWQNYTPQVRTKRWSVDRFDNMEGYTLDNIRFCCVVCNVWKGITPWVVFSETKKGIEVLWRRIFHSF